MGYLRWVEGPDVPDVLHAMCHGEPPRCDQRAIKQPVRGLRDGGVPPHPWVLTYLPAGCAQIQGPGDAINAPDQHLRLHSRRAWAAGKIALARHD
jgi:hypothetical protein